MNESNPMCCNRNKATHEKKKSGENALKMLLGNQAPVGQKTNEWEKKIYIWAACVNKAFVTTAEKVFKNVWLGEAHWLRPCLSTMSTCRLFPLSQRLASWRREESYMSYPKGPPYSVLVSNSPPSTSSSLMTYSSSHAKRGKQKDILHILTNSCI